MKQDYFEFYAPVKLIAGKKAVLNLPLELSRLGSKSPLLISDRGIEKVGLLKKVLKAFNDSAMSIKEIFLDVPPDSDTKVVSEIVKKYREKECDAIVAIGGGSVIDTAKGVNTLVSLGGDDLSEHAGANAIETPFKPLIVIPTTAGTGSEVTVASVIKNGESERKMLFVSASILPDTAIIDPEMTESLPPYLTAITAMDALTHAIEATYCLGRNPMSDIYAHKAIERISENLFSVLENPSDLDRRFELALASTMAGVAFSNSMVGLVHSLGHALGAVCHVPHGLAMSIFLPYVLEFNLETNREDIGALLNYFSHEKADGDKAEHVIKIIRSWQEKLYDQHQVPYTLSQTGKVEKSQFQAIVAAAMDDAAMTYNPRAASREQCMEILEKAF